VALDGGGRAAFFSGPNCSSSSFMINSVRFDAGSPREGVYVHATTPNPIFSTSSPDYLPWSNGVAPDAGVAGPASRLALHGLPEVAITNFGYPFAVEAQDRPSRIIPGKSGRIAGSPPAYRGKSVPSTTGPARYATALPAADNPYAPAWANITPKRSIRHTNPRPDSLVKAIAEAHGGRLLLHSVPGAGTTFTLRLPANGGIVPKAGDGEDITVAG